MKISVIQWEKLCSEEKIKQLKRPSQASDPGFKAQVREIINTVRVGKDESLHKFTLLFDKISLSATQVTKSEILEAYNHVKPRTLSALKEAIRRISLFHRAQLPSPIDLETSMGVRCERRFVPIERVGLYIPGGTAPLPSTVLMLGVPAQIAGCQTRILATPPREDQTIDPTILVAADLLGISEIFKMGGAQAIAALAYGTQTIQKVDKIFGPGNAWVTEAKAQVSQDPNGAACDLPAGPSEVMVIADDTANPCFVAADLLSQAEHGTDSQVVLISDSRTLINSVLSELTQQLEVLPRKTIASEALSKSVLIQVSKIEDSISICNDYAPEHLILQVENPRSFAQNIVHAGSVFLGPWTPESVGDYASGTNHVLPTYGFSKTYSGLGTESFMRSITFQELSFEGLKELGPVVEELAEAEGLHAHKNAVRIRLNPELPGASLIKDDL